MSDNSDRWYSSSQIEEVSAIEANEWLLWTRLEGGRADTTTVKAMHEKVRCALLELDGLRAENMRHRLGGACENATRS